MKKYKVTGMSCAACSARVEKAVSALDGVTSCSVSLLTSSMGVEGNASDEQIIAAVVGAGYGAEAADSSAKSSPKTDAKLDNGNEIATLRNRLVVSAGFLIILMYVSMGHVMWGFPLPAFFAQNPVAIALLQLLLCAAVMVINQKFFISGAKGLIHRAPNMDTLVSLGSGISFVYSLIRVIFMFSDKTGDAHSYLHGLYFESAAMILTLITVGKLLEEIAKGKTTSAVKELMDLSPKTARIEKDGTEITVDASKICVGDIFILRSGDSVPADGEIIFGECSLVESALTGESVPVDKGLGDKVFAATINSSGYVKCRATSVGKDTAISEVIRLVEEAGTTKAPISKIADKVSGFFVPIIVGIAALTFVIWWINSQDLGYSVGRAISVLVISCPCSLGLATPVAIMVGSGAGAKNGILYKTAEALELTGRAKKVLLDKTGTVTRGEPEVVGVYPIESVSEEYLLSLAYSLEERSEHPQAKAILLYAKSRVQKKELTEFSAVRGSGVSGKTDGKIAYGGNLKFILKESSVEDSLIKLSEKLSDEGKTPMFFAEDGKAVGIIATADALRPDSPQAIADLKRLGMSVTLLTGDNSRVANAVGKAAGIDSIISDAMPKNKAEVVEALSKEERVIMVGDGINDAPSLALADVGIAIGAGSDVAINSADVVLVRSSLSDVASAVRLGRRVLKCIRENLFFAFVYNLIGVPMAAGLFGFAIDPMFGAFAMSLSSLSVVLNSLRIGRFANNSLQKTKTEKSATATEIKKEKTKMKTVLKVEGMMCPHCENRVKEALLSTPGVISAEVDYKTGEAAVEADTPSEALISAVESAGYKAFKI